MKRIILDLKVNVFLLFFCFFLFSHSLINIHDCVPTAVAGNTQWRDVFENPNTKSTPSDKSQGNSQNDWNTVIDYERHRPEPDQKKKIEEKSPVPMEVKLQPQDKNAQDPSSTPPEALSLIEVLLTSNLPAEMPPTLYIHNMTSVQYAGAVSMAMEGMRIFYGDMDEEQERLFEARWMPLFNYPSQEIIAYLNQLNPLLVLFLALRASLNENLEEFNATQFEIVGAAQIGDAQAIVAAMETAVLYSTVGKVLNYRLQKVGEEIIALGDPPNAAALRKKAREKHEAAINEFFKKPGVSISPARLKAVLGKEYTFKVTVDDEKLKKDKLSFKWYFDDDAPGWGKPENGVLTIKKVFREEDKNKHTLTVKLQRYPGPETLATLVSEILMINDPGCWTLVDCQIRSDTNEFLSYTMDKEARRIEGSFLPPSFVPETLDRFSYLHTWEAPPQRLFPGARVQIPVTVKRLHTYDKMNISTEDYSKMSEPERTRHETRKKNCLRPSFTSVSWLIALNADELANYFGSGEGVTLKAGEAEAKALSAPFTVAEYDYENQWLKDRMLWLQVTAGDKFVYTEDAKGLSEVWTNDSASVIYGYKWDPSGNQVKPLDLGEGVARAAAESSETSDGADDKVDKIIFHQHNIDHFTRNIEAIKKQLEEAKDIKEKNTLVRDLLYASDARQREIDAITSIQKGEFVRTRTQLDALNMKIMADESRILADRWHTIKRIMERGPRVIDLAPAGEREALRQFFNRHVTGENVASGHPEKLNQAIKAISDKVIGSLEIEKEAHENDAEFWDIYLEKAQNVKAFTDTYMMILSFAAAGAGPSYALFGQPGLITAAGVTYQVYGAATGFIEGGWKESVSRTLAGFNAVTTVVDAGMRGYQSGVLQHLEEYARDPQKVVLDEEKAGFKGAAWSAGTAAAFAVAVKFGMNAYQKRQQIIKQQEAWRQLECDLVKHEFRMRYYNKRFAQADVKIKTFEQCRVALAQAGQAGASKEEILKLRAQLDEAYKDIKTDWFAKTRMKALAADADFRTAAGSASHKTVHAYNSADRRFTKQLQNKLSERMTNAGFNAQKYKTFSNSASKGGVGMDIDMGVIEPPRFTTVNGKQVPNPAHAEWRNNLSRNVDGKTQRVSPHDLQKAGNEELKAAFEDVYGRKPGEAMVEFTTSYNPEAYRDPRWLGSKKSKTALAYSTDPHWTQQAADVTDFKVNTLAKDHPSLGYYATMQENCRGIAKDMKLKLQPLMKNSKNPEAVKHMQQIQETMEALATNQIGPLEAEHRLRILTGNKDGVTETAKRFSVMLQGLKN